MPESFIETPTGLLLISNGMDPVLRWDSLTPDAEPAGVQPPLVAVTMIPYQPPTPTPGVSSAQLSLLYYNLLTQSGGGGGFYSLATLYSPLGQALYAQAQLVYKQYVAALAIETAAAKALADGTVSPPPVFDGTYYAYVRFVDNLGNYSNLSPISPAIILPLTGPITAYDSRVAPNIITAPAHGLTTGTIVTISAWQYFVYFPGMPVFPTGNYTITVLDANRFTLTNSVATGSYSNDTSVPPYPLIPAGGAGTLWSVALAGFKYTNVATPTEAKVRRRQIVRNTSGQTQTFYVDIDTTDLSSTTFTSVNTDTQLEAQQAVPLFDSVSGAYLANRYGIPPAHKAVIVPQLGRMFAAVEVDYAEGSAQVVYGSVTVQGIGTEWTASFPGRFLYVVGAGQSYQIASVDVVNQVITLLNAYLDPSNPYANYAIRPAPAERRLIYYSGAFLPEAWDVLNALSLPEDGDDMTGLMAKASFLFILERRHIYRFTFQLDPAVDGYVFLAALRGCVNQRCWVVCEDVAYMMDEQGFHAFDGQGSKPISLVIQDLFENENNEFRINWQAKKFFHAVHYPAQNTVRWFVALEGWYLPQHAIAYDYRQEHWWMEEFSTPIGSSCTGEMQGISRVFLGTSAKRTLAYWMGTLDGPDPSAGTVRGTVTKATNMSLTDSLALFPSKGVVNNPVVIVSGRGKGQQRTIAAVVGTTLQLMQPWAILPDTTSVYQVGGIPWRFRSGWFRFVDDETTNPRDLEVVFDPLTYPASMDIRLYYDHQTKAEVWRTDLDSTAGAGIASTAGSTDLVADLTKPNGVVHQQMHSRREENADAHRFVQVEIGGVSNLESALIHEMTLKGAHQ